MIKTGYRYVSILVVIRLKLLVVYFFVFFQAEDGIRDAQESRGLGDVYKRQGYTSTHIMTRTGRVMCMYIRGHAQDAELLSMTIYLSLIHI